MTRKRKIKFAIMTAIFLAVVSFLYLGTATGYVWMVTGVYIPWPRESVEEYDCDFGRYSIFVLKESSMKEFVSKQPWKSNIPLGRYQNDCLTFDSRKLAKPLPPPAELIWMEGARKYEDWTMYLHVPTRRLFVSIGHPDMAGDLPARAMDNHQECDATFNGG